MRREQGNQGEKSIAHAVFTRNYLVNPFCLLQRFGNPDKDWKTQFLYSVFPQLGPREKDEVEGGDPGIYCFQLNMTGYTPIFKIQSIKNERNFFD
jgi:hypothetical protein